MKLEIQLQRNALSFYDSSELRTLCANFVDNWLNEILLPESKRTQNVLLTISSEEFDDSTEFRYIPMNTNSGVGVLLFTPNGERVHEIYYNLDDLLKSTYDDLPIMPLYFTLKPVHAMNESKTQTEN